MLAGDDGGRCGMSGTRAGGTLQSPAAGETEGHVHWQRTLWAMVAVQLVMSISFSILSPIMPLFLPRLGVATPEAVDLWAGVLASISSFIGIFAAPIWGHLADRYGRKLMVLRSSFGIAAF